MYNFFSQIANQKITFGKLKNKTLNQIVANQQAYADQIINNNEFRNNPLLQQKFKFLKYIKLYRNNQLAQHQTDSSRIQSNSSKFRSKSLRQQKIRGIVQMKDLGTVSVMAEPLKKSETIKKSEINNLKQQKIADLKVAFKIEKPFCDQISKKQIIEDQKINEYQAKIKKLQNIINKQNETMNKFQNYNQQNKKKVEEIVNKCSRQIEQKNRQIEQKNRYIDQKNRQSEQKNRYIEQKNRQLNNLMELLIMQKNYNNQKSVYIDQLTQYLNKYLKQINMIQIFQEQKINQQKIMYELHNKNQKLESTLQYQKNLKNKIIRDFQIQRSKFSKIQQQAYTKYQKQIKQLELQNSTQKSSIYFIKEQLNQEKRQHKTSKQSTSFIIFIIFIYILAKYLF